jgi:hypothetical protein
MDNETEKLIEIIKQYEIKNASDNEKRIKNVQQMRVYFQETTKHRTEHCKICDKHVKKNSYYNHLNSQKHQKKLLDFKFSKD